MTVFHMAADYGSTDPLRRARRLVPHIWTAPTKARAGDVAVLYSTTDHEWMAIGRIVHEPVRSTIDGKWWTYVQWLPVRSPLAYDEACRAPELASWKKLKQMAGRHAAISPPSAGEHLLHRLSQRDTQAKARLIAWRRPHARLPQVDEQDLLEAHWQPSPPPIRLPDEHERFLALEIEEILVKRRKARARTVDDACAVGSSPAVCLRPAHAERRFPDIVLIDRTRERTLLLIEVKLHAKLSDLRGGLRDVVDQVLEYQALMAELDTSWTVRPVIVAERVNGNVVERARDAEVDVWRINRATRRFTALAGEYG